MKSDFETEREAARERWAKLSGEDMAEVIDHCGDGVEAIKIMLAAARRRFESDAWQVLHALHVRSRADTAVDMREFVKKNESSHVALFDKYARLAAEELKLDEAWIDGEADAALEFPSDDGDRAFDEARDDGRI